jgi:dCTP diphosphatase
MNDNTKTVQELKDQVTAFIRERDWEQFHTPGNLASAIAIEAAELMEHFLWLDAAGSRQAVIDNRQEIEDELADIAILMLRFADLCSIDVSSALVRKLAKNAVKYPVDKAKGKSTKYNKL